MITYFGEINVKDIVHCGRLKPITAKQEEVKYLRRA
jgi:hypothetical protein